MEKNRFTYSVNFSFASDCSESNNWSVFGRANCRFCSSLYDGDVILPLTILCLDCLAVVPGYYLVCYNEYIIRQCNLVAVVPGYYLVCYNTIIFLFIELSAVVPGYYLGCYNPVYLDKLEPNAVVPGYYLVCYNKNFVLCVIKKAVVPGYYLVCYNSFHCTHHIL